MRHAWVAEFGRRKGLKIPHHNVVCRFDSGPRHHKTNHALMPSKRHGLGFFNFCSRPPKAIPPTRFQKSLAAQNDFGFENAETIEQNDGSRARHGGPNRWFTVCFKHELQLILPKVGSPLDLES
jgi:hypothetical protein